jgi:hypothetical protein
MGGRQIVLVWTAGFSVHNMGIFWREAKTKRLFSQCILKKYNHPFAKPVLYLLFEFSCGHGAVNTLPALAPAQ